MRVFTSAVPVPALQPSADSSSTENAFTRHILRSNIMAEVTNKELLTRGNNSFELSSPKHEFYMLVKIQMIYQTAMKA